MLNGPCCRETLARPDAHIDRSSWASSTIYDESDSGSYHSRIRNARANLLRNHRVAEGGGAVHFLEDIMITNMKRNVRAETPSVCGLSRAEL